MKKHKSIAEEHSPRDPLYAIPMTNSDGSDAFNWKSAQAGTTFNLSEISVWGTAGNVIDVLHGMDEDMGTDSPLKQMAQWGSQEISLWEKRIRKDLKGDDFIPKYMLSGIKCIGFDVDGCIAKYKGDGTLYPKAKDFIAKWRGYKAVITNQGGPACRDAWGYENLPTMDEVQERIEYVMRQIDPNHDDPSTQVWVSWAYYHKKDDAWLYPKGFEGDKEYSKFLRKPNPGMILSAIEYFDVDEDEFLYVGDMESDKEAAKRAGVRFYQVNMEGE